MGIENVLFKSEEKKDRSEVVTFLRTIADKIDKGGLTLRQDSNEVALEFPDQMVMEIKVEEEQGKRIKRSFEIELEWGVGNHTASATQII